jgi:hypothetical protein
MGVWICGGYRLRKKGVEWNLRYLEGILGDGMLVIVS